MNTQQIVDFSALVVSLTGPGRISARRARALAGRLEREAPSDLTAAERAALMLLVAAADRCDAAVIAQSRQGPLGTREARNVNSQAWTAMSLALQAFMLVPRWAEAARRIHDALFGETESFVRLDAVGAWGQARRMLSRIDGEGFAATLDAMGFSVLVEQARSTTEALGEVIGVSGASSPEPIELEVAEAHERFNAAVSRYARVLSASVDEAQPDSIHRFLRALAGLEEAKKAGPRDGEDDVTEPGAPAAPTDSGAPFTG